MDSRSCKTQHGTVSGPSGIRPVRCRPLRDCCAGSFGKVTIAAVTRNNCDESVLTAKTRLTLPAWGTGSSKASSLPYGILRRLETQATRSNLRFTSPKFSGSAAVRHVCRPGNTEAASGWIVELRSRALRPIRSTSIDPQIRSSSELGCFRFRGPCESLNRQCQLWLKLSWSEVAERGMATIQIVIAHLRRLFTDRIKTVVVFD